VLVTQGPVEEVEICFKRLIFAVGAVTVKPDEAVLPLPPLVELTAPLVLV
jgi:hypothetical protein